MGKLQSKYSYAFDGKIWNIISGHNTDQLLLEIRNADKFQVEFSIIDVNTGNFLLKNHRFEENWWIGASYHTAGIILFHTYVEQDNPDFKNFFAFDIKEKKTLWRHENMKLIQSMGNNISVLYEGADEVFTLDLATGSRKEEILRGADENNPVTNPFYYAQGSEHFNTVRLFIESRFNLQIIKGAHYYEDEDFIMISYYCENDKLVNKLLILSRRGEVLLEEKIGDNLPGVGDDTFFIFREMLIFVKDYSDFLIYQLIRDGV